MGVRRRFANCSHQLRLDMAANLPECNVSKGSIRKVELFVVTQFEHTQQY